MHIAEIRDAVVRAPTIMDVDDEAAVARQLMALPHGDVASDWAAFDEIADHLYESHTDTFVEVDERLMPVFSAFAGWLDALAHAEVGNRQAWLLQLAEHFRIDPQRVAW